MAARHPGVAVVEQLSIFFVLWCLLVQFVTKARIRFLDPMVTASAAA